MTGTVAAIIIGLAAIAGGWLLMRLRLSVPLLVAVIVGSGLVAFYLGGELGGAFGDTRATGARARALDALASGNGSLAGAIPHWSAASSMVARSTTVWAISGAMTWVLGLCIGIAWHYMRRKPAPAPQSHPGQDQP